MGDDDQIKTVTLKVDTYILDRGGAVMVLCILCAIVGSILDFYFGTEVAIMSLVFFAVCISFLVGQIIIRVFIKKV